MAPATNALTTVARVKDAVPVPCSDSRVEFVINEVSANIAEFLGRQLGFAAVATSSPDYYKGSGSLELWLRRLPILTITRVRIYDVEITDYFRTTERDQLGCLMRGTGPIGLAVYGFPQDGVIWPDLTGDLNLREDFQSWNIDICGTFGFVLPQFDGILNATHNPTSAAATLPASIEGACISEVLYRIFNPIPGLKSESTPGAWDKQWEKQGTAFNLTDRTVAALAPYCRPGRWFA